MPEQILPGLFRLEIPLPQNPLKAINSYVIKDQNRNLIIDTGLNRAECNQALSKGLAELSIDLNKTDFFATHMHADHSALIPVLQTAGSVTYASAPDAASIRNFVTNYANWRVMVQYAHRNGMDENEAQEAIKRHPGLKFGPKSEPNFVIVGDQSTVSAGDYHFICIETPGHTSGHLCLYEPDKKLLLSGDHVLGDITPNISAWSDEGNPLGDYLNSLNKIKSLAVNLVLPGHRRIFTDCLTRIKELQEHHAHRNEEILSILGTDRLTAFAIAARMTWDMTYPSFNDFPAPQKWFATGEAIAHLRYLETRQLITREQDGIRTVYRR